MNARVYLVISILLDEMTGNEASKLPRVSTVKEVIAKGNAINL